jgi:hypothetical protein
MRDDYTPKAAFAVYRGLVAAFGPPRVVALSTTDGH